MVILRRIGVRLGAGLATLWVVSIVVFLGTTALPGDAVTASLGQYGSNQPPQVIQAMRNEFGLNKPLLTRYEEWLAGLVHGDFGRSLPSGASVTAVVSDKGRNTLTLVVIATILLVPLSLILGVASAVRRGRWFDHGITVTTLSLVSLPEFVVGTLLAVVLGVWAGLFPPVSLIDPARSPLSQLPTFALPVLTLLAAMGGQTIRMVRATMIEVLESEYVQMARLKGVPEVRVLFLHALPNAAAPIVQILAMNIAWMVGGIVVIETVFQFPGIGYALTSAVSARDLPTVEALAMIITAAYVAVNLVADIIVILADPRLRRRIG